MGGGAKGTGTGKIRFKVRDFFADERCSWPILDFKRTTDVGRRVEPGGGGGGGGAKIVDVSLPPFE